MLTRGEARSVIENTLAGRKPMLPMTPEEMLAFCQEMMLILDFRTTDKLADIRRWATAWEAKRFR